MLTGGFPELLLWAKANGQQDESSALLQSQHILRNDAVERAIYKDIPQVFGVDNPLLLERLLYTLAGQLAGILSPNAICSKLDSLSQPTFNRYLSYLEGRSLCSRSRTIRGTRRRFRGGGGNCTSSTGAIRNAALQRGLAPLSNDEEMGLLIENMAAGRPHVSK